MEEHRLIFEYLTRKAFGVENRKDLYCADADYFDRGNLEAIIVLMSAALFVQLPKYPSQKEWIDSTIKKLSSKEADYSTVCSVLDELPYELQ